MGMMRGGPRKKKVTDPKFKCRKLTPEEIANCGYTPPLSKLEIQLKNSVPSPDRSHHKPKKNHKAKSKNG